MAQSIRTSSSPSDLCGATIRPRRGLAPTTSQRCAKHQPRCACFFARAQGPPHAASVQAPNGGSPPICHMPSAICHLTSHHSPSPTCHCPFAIVNRSLPIAYITRSWSGPWVICTGAIYADSYPSHRSMWGHDSPSVRPRANHTTDVRSINLAICVSASAQRSSPAARAQAPNGYPPPICHLPSAFFLPFPISHVIPPFPIVHA